MMQQAQSTMEIHRYTDSQIIFTIEPWGDRFVLVVFDRYDTFIVREICDTKFEAFYYARDICQAYCEYNRGSAYDV